jgi:hypothetical protein
MFAAGWLFSCGEELIIENAEGAERGNCDHQDTKA